MNTPLVSIVVPCYNMENNVDRFVDSIMIQDYPNIELIMVDDGSVDNTYSSIELKRSLIESKEIRLILIRKRNEGAAAAINTGLKFVTGEFLIWPDSDDFLLPNSIKNRVDYMLHHESCALLRTNAYIYNEANLNRKVGSLVSTNRTYSVEDFARFKIVWCPGCYMIRMKYFDSINPHREIYVSRAGQNIQMLLPMVYYFGCDSMEDSLYGYVIYNKSHSHSIKTYEQHMKHIRDLEICVKETLKNIQGDTRWLFKLTRIELLKISCNKAWEFQKKSDFEKYINELSSLSELTIQLKLMKHLSYNKWSELLIRSINYFQRRIRND